jgi:hypothetical protein
VDFLTKRVSFLLILLILTVDPAHSVTVAYRPGGKIYEDFLKGFKEGWGATVREVANPEPSQGASSLRDPEGLVILGSALWDTLSPLLKEERLAPIYILGCVLEAPAGPPKPDWTVDLKVPVSEWGAPLLQIAPYVKSVGVIITKSSRENASITEAEKWLKDKKVRLIRIPVASHKEVVQQFRQNLRDLQAVWMFPDPVLGRLEVVDFILETSLRNGIIVVGPSEYYTQRGALLSVEPDYYALGKETALALKRRLEDANAAPPTLTRFRLTLNRRTAFALQITLSRAILDSADRVF